MQDTVQSICFNVVCLFAEEETAELLEAKRLELEGVKAAERDDVIGSLNYFNQAINVAPNRASGYNNRAQALRLQNDTEGNYYNLTEPQQV